VHIDLSSWEAHLLEGLLELLRHFYHQLIVEIGHLLAIIYSWWRPSLMQILDAINPSGNLLWLFVRMLYRVHINRGCSNDILALHILELEHCLILAVECWLIKLSDTKILLSSIWLRHFEASIHFSNCWHIIGNEWLQFSIEVKLLWLVPLNILEQVFDILRHLQVGVLCWVVSSGNFFIIFTFFIILGSWLLGQRSSLLLL
jgi:hypothetical protein